MNDNTLDKNHKLMQHMATFARFAFQETGELQPMWLLQNADGMIQPVMTPFDTPDGKDKAARAIRTAIKAHGAIRYGFMSEAWMVTIKKEDPEFPDAHNIQPSTHRDRREIIKLLVEDDQGGHVFGHFYILRPETGKPSLSPLKLNNEYDNVGGRFSGLFQKAKSS